MRNPAELIQPYLYDAFFWTAERLGMASRRRRLLSAARGRVLEIGAGTGLNVPLYSHGPDELVLTEPDLAFVGHLRSRAERSGVPTEVVEIGAEELPFPDDSFDTVVSTLVLCTVPAAEKAVAEAARVLRPGGQLLFIEHLRGEPGGLLERVQDRLDPAWSVFAEGCHCNRSTLDLLDRSPLTVQSVERSTWRAMPRIIKPLAVGRAVA